MNLNQEKENPNEVTILFFFLIVFKNPNEACDPRLYLNSCFKSSIALKAELNRFLRKDSDNKIMTNQ